MELVERLKSARADVADALAEIEQGFRSGEDVAASSTAQRLVEELWRLEESAWGSLLASLEDDEELHGVLTRLRIKFSEMRKRRDLFFSPIRKFGHRAFFDFNSGGLVVEMHFVKDEGESLEVRQDLEDTLRIGASIIDSIADVMHKMDVLSIQANRRCIGQEFEKNLKVAARGLEKIEEVFNSVRDP